MQIKKSSELSDPFTVALSKKYEQVSEKWKNTESEYKKLYYQLNK